MGGKIIILSLFLASFASAASCPCSSASHCEVTINVADWFGRGPSAGHVKDNLERDERNPYEVGWHVKDGGSLAEIKFLQTPEGKHPRIMRLFADTYATFTDRGSTSATPHAVALHAVHSKNNFDFSQVNVSNCADCILWLQTPFGVYGQARQVDRYVGNLPMSLLTHNAIWFKLSAFANLGGDEILSEMTVSLEYCYE